LIEQVIEQLSNRHAETLLSLLVETAIKRRCLVQQCQNWWKMILKNKFGHLVKNKEILEKLQSEIRSSLGEWRSNLKEENKAKNDKKRKKSTEKSPRKPRATSVVQEENEKPHGKSLDTNLLRKLHNLLGQIDLITPETQKKEQKPKLGSMGVFNGFAGVTEEFLSSTTSTSRSRRLKNKLNKPKKQKKQTIEMEEEGFDEEEEMLEKALDEFEEGMEGEEMEEEDSQEEEDMNEFGSEEEGSASNMWRKKRGEEDEDF
jgi:hypothetical protein